MEYTDPQLEEAPAWEKRPSNTLQLFLLLFVFILVGSFLGALIMYLTGQIGGISPDEVIASLNENSPLKDRNYGRLFNGIGHFMTFSVPALVIALIFYKRKWLSFLKLNQLPRLGNVLLSFIFIITAAPLVGFTYWLNKKVPMPAWMTEMEEQAEVMIQGILNMQSPAEVIFTLFIVAVLPAVGEELVFRGIIQQKLQERLKPLVAIWLTAFIFSAVHLQFAGFIPRFLIGGLLGYLFFYSRNLWIPIIAHFFFNGIQVLIQYGSGNIEEEAAFELGAEAYWVPAIFSLIIVMGISVVIKRYNTEKTYV